MSQQYLWMVALAAGWLRRSEDADAPGPLAMAVVTSQGGAFAIIPTRAANDASALAILIGLLLVCASYRAKLTGRRAFSTEICATDRWAADTPQTLALLGLAGLIGCPPGSARMIAPPGQGNRRVP